MQRGKMITGINDGDLYILDIYVTYLAIKGEGQGHCELPFDQ